MGEPARFGIRLVARKYSFFLPVFEVLGPRYLSPTAAWSRPRPENSSVSRRDPGIERHRHWAISRLQLACTPYQRIVFSMAVFTL